MFHTFTQVPNLKMFNDHDFSMETKNRIKVATCDTNFLAQYATTMMTLCSLIIIHLVTLQIEKIDIAI